MKLLQWISCALLSFTVITYSFIDSPSLFADEKNDAKAEAKLSPVAKLPEDDKKQLDSLLKEILIDPTGAEYVKVERDFRSVWVGDESVETSGWLVKRKDSKIDRIYFVDGESMDVAPGTKFKKIDFEDECRFRYVTQSKAANDMNREDHFAYMKTRAVGCVQNLPLADAAWLYKLGKEDLAAQVMDSIKRVDRSHRSPEIDEFRHALAWATYAGMVHAYMVRADEDSLRYGERLLKLYPQEAKKEFKQAEEIVTELKRRKKVGTFTKNPGKNLPQDFENWEISKKIAFLIDSMDEVDARQDGQPGGIDFSNDFRIAELIKIGDSAVPALIDALDSDKRFTRSVHFWRDFSSNRTVIATKEPILVCIMSILKVRVFKPVATGDNFTARGEDAAKDTVAQVRAYWKEYGSMTHDERMMKVLVNRKTTFDQKREAAENLAMLGEERTIGTTFGPVMINRQIPDRVNPVIAKFKNPTVAEAILATMDAELAEHDKKPDDNMKDYYRQRIESQYIQPLNALDDKRIAKEIVTRYEKSSLNSRMRRKLALLAFRLGEQKPMLEFAKNFELGKIDLPKNDEPNRNEDDQPGNVALDEIIGYLSSIDSPEATNALNALANTEHVYHKLVTARVLNERPESSHDHSWFDHPYCLQILRRSLDDQTTTGTIYAVDSEGLHSKAKNSSGTSSIPDIISDPKVRREQAEERICDNAAQKIAALVAGVPKYHLLHRDSETQLSQLKLALDKYRGSYRRANRLEQTCLDQNSWSPLFIPRFTPLVHAATEDDIKSGKAIFSLKGMGKLSDEKLPLIADLKDGKSKDDPTRVIIVQAERDNDGKLQYGIIARHEISVISADEVVNLRTYEQFRDYLIAEQKKQEEEWKKRRESRE